MVAALLTIFLFSCGYSPSYDLLLNKRVTEIGSVQPYFRMPVPDWSGKHVAYVQAIGPGRRLFVCELNSLSIRAVPITNDVCQVFGWSQDDRFLAFAQAPPTSPRGDDEAVVAWVTLYDLMTGKTQRVGTQTGVAEANAIWLQRDRLFFSVHKLGSDYTEKFIFNLNSGLTEKVRNYCSDFVLMPTNVGAFFNNGNIQACALDTTNYPPIFNLTDFGANTFDQMRWLRFRDETDSFLFCARKADSNWRCLYEFFPATRQMRQLTMQSTYNGQCLGRGFAFVGNTNNGLYLALRPTDSSLTTNLFTGGNVITYAASKDGNRVYAIASEDAEPPSLWEYDITKRQLRRLVNSQTKEWQSASLVRPEGFWIKSFDGLAIPYFVVPPAQLVKNPASTNQFPVVLYLPPATWQFQRAFDQPAQFYANLDCWYLAVNYRGGDGYGKAFNELKNTADAAHDALFVLAELGQNRNVNLKKVILSSESSGAEEVLELLRNSPEKWLGAVMHHPALSVSAAEGLPKKSPPLFVVAGGLERSVPRLREFEAAAKEGGLAVRLRIQKYSGHETFSVDEIRETMLDELSFFRAITR